MKGLLAVTVLLLCACASNNANLVRESARFMSVEPDSVRISNVQRGMSNVKWQATAPKKGVWKCTSDDMLRRPYCAQADSSTSKTPSR